MVRANYILLDSAKMESEMVTARGLNPEHTCLYEGDNEKYYGVVAPWLFDFKVGSEFAKWITLNGQGNDWGIFIRSESEPHQVYEHLRKFIVVRTEDGNELFFRFYDPRVLRVFLPTCNRDQLKEFFGPIDAFIAEDENGLLIEYGYSEESLNAAPLNKKMNELGEGTEPQTNVDQTKDPISANQSETRSSNFAPPEKQKITDRHEPDSDDDDQATDKKDLGWDFGY